MRIAFIAAAILLHGFVDAQSASKTRILIVLDASGSMAGKWQGDSKFDIATDILFNTIDSIERELPNVEFGLRVFGHQYHKSLNNCEDTKLEVRFGRGNAPRMKTFLSSVVNQGQTPIAWSLSEAVKDFPGDTRVRNIIVLITDGIETCDGDPCALAAQFRARNIALRPFVIGLGMGEAGKDYFECVGTYVDAQDESSFQGAMDVVITQAMYTTTAQVNLLDISGMPTETDVEVTLFDSQTGDVLDNFVHAIRYGNVPDTLVLSPVTSYDMTVHTIPPVEVKNIELTIGRHNIIAASTPQGELVLRLAGRHAFTPVQCVVRQAGKAEILQVQNLNTRKKYLVGNYDVEILTLPKLEFRNVKIANKKESEILVPEPGTLQLKPSTSGLMSIFMRNSDGRPVKIWEDEVSQVQYLKIQPGDYEVVFRTHAIRSARVTQVKKIKVNSRSNILVQF